MAQAACSREEPEPKFSPEIKIVASFRSGAFKINAGFGDPSSKKRHSSKRCLPKPALSTCFKKPLGMIWSVSMLSFISGTVFPV